MLLPFWLLAASAAAEGAWEADQFGVFDLGDDTFAGFLKAHPVAVLNFYAPWCRHCKELGPHFDRLPDLIARNPLLFFPLDSRICPQILGRLCCRAHPGGQGGRDGGEGGGADGEHQPLPHHRPLQAIAAAAPP